MVEERAEVLNGTTYKVKCGCGSLYVIVNEDKDKNPIEVFAILGKSGICARASTEAIARLITLHLKSGGTLDKIIKYIGSISCSSQIFDSNYSRQILSCSDGISAALERHLKVKEKK